MRFLYIDDKREETEAMRKIFELHFAYCGLICETVNAAEEGIERARLRNYDALIVDIMLNGPLDGYDIVLKLRAAKVKVPILILSGLSSVEQKIKGLGYGADDFVTKPFKRGELLARLQAIIRRAKGHSDSVISFGPGNNGKINIDSRTVYVNGYGNVNLTSKEYSILELLALRKGCVISKEAFLNHLYGGYEEPHVKIVDVFCCKTRKKLNNAFLYAKNVKIKKLRSMVKNDTIYNLPEFKDKNKNYIESYIMKLEEQDVMNSISTLWGRGYVLRDFSNTENNSNKIDKYWGDVNNNVQDNFIDTQNNKFINDDDSDEGYESSEDNETLSTKYGENDKIFIDQNYRKYDSKYAEMLKKEKTEDKV